MYTISGIRTKYLYFSFHSEQNAICTKHDHQFISFHCIFLGMESSNNNNTNIVRLMSGDGKIFEVEEVMDFESQIVKKVMEDLGTHTTIPCPLISNNILEKTIQYCRHHVLHAPHHVNSMWDLRFLQTLDDHETFLKLVLAAHYLCINNFLDLTCQAM
jgi:hypothetical protein